MTSEELLEQSWKWLDDFWDAHDKIITFDEDKKLCEVRKKWQKETMPYLKHYPDRARVADELNIIFKLSDMSWAYPDTWETEELKKWCQKYDKLWFEIKFMNKDL